MGESMFVALVFEKSFDEWGYRKNFWHRSKGEEVRERGRFHNGEELAWMITTQERQVN